MNDYLTLLRWPRAGWTLGLLLGLIIEAIVRLVAPDVSLGMFLMIAISFPLIGFLFKLPPPSKMVKWFSLLLIIGLIYGVAGGCLMHVYLQGKHSFTSYPEMLFVQLKLSSLIVLAFYCTLVSSEGYRFSYNTLFHESWQLLQKSILGTLLAILFFGLCLLSARLFDLLNVSWVSRVVYWADFKLIMFPIFFGIAMSILHEHEELLRKLRSILLSFCHVLYPVFVVISLSFLVALFFSDKKLADIWTTINMLAVFNIFLINGVFQQGDWIKPPYGRFLSLLINLLLFVLTAYLAYDLQFSLKVVSQASGGSVDNGLRVLRFYRPGLLTLIFSSILLAYHLGYSLAVVFKQGTWLGLLKRVNILLAGIVAAVYLGLAFLGGLLPMMI